MKKSIAVLAVAGMLTSTAFGAAPPQSDSIAVTASNAGVFTFNIVAAAYSFGTVDSSGTANIGGTQAITGVRNGGDTGATYTAAAATTWTSSSAPTRTVHIFNASAGSSIIWGTADRLEMQIPNTGLGAAVSCGYRTFSTTGNGGAGGCGSGNLIHGITVGNGASSKTGNLDFRLTVLDTDIIGSNSWTVTLTATNV